MNHGRAGERWRLSYLLLASNVMVAEDACYWVSSS